jgi:hypothetical protein
LFFHGSARALGAANFFYRRQDDLLETVVATAATVFVNRHILTPFESQIAIANFIWQSEII